MTTVAIIGLLLLWIFIVMLILALWAPTPIDSGGPTGLKPPCPDSCEDVAIPDIASCQDGISPGGLKSDYVQTEKQLIAAHDPAMQRQIASTLAQCLTEGLPLNTGICQAAHNLVTGNCQCKKCHTFHTRN